MSWIFNYGIWSICEYQLNLHFQLDYRILTKRSGISGSLHLHLDCHSCSRMLLSGCPVIRAPTPQIPTLQDYEMLLWNTSLIETDHCNVCTALKPVRRLTTISRLFSVFYNGAAIIIMFFKRTHKTRVGTIADMSCSWFVPLHTLHIISYEFLALNICYPKNILFKWFDHKRMDIL